MQGCKILKYSDWNVHMCTWQNFIRCMYMQSKLESDLYIHFYIYLYSCSRIDCAAIQFEVPLWVLESHCGSWNQWQSDLGPNLTVFNPESPFRKSRKTRSRRLIIRVFAKSRNKNEKYPGFFSREIFQKLIPCDLLLFYPEKNKNRIFRHESQIIFTVSIITYPTPTMYRIYIQNGE